MRTPRELTEASSMEEVTDELQKLNEDQHALQQVYARAASLDPDYVEIEKRRQIALYHMRMMAYR